MAIQLNRELEAEIDDEVSSGAYRSADDVIRKGLGLINAREELRQAIAAGAAQLDRGEGIPGEQVFEELRTRPARDVVPFLALWGNHRGLHGGHP